MGSCGCVASHRCSDDGLFRLLPLHLMTIHPIAFFKSPLSSKFGMPRQSGIVSALRGEIVFQPEYRDPSFIRGIEGFDYLWLLWQFSANRHEAARATVRPPLLGGNRSQGVFATRSPYRPNPIGLSSVRLESVTFEGAEGPVLHVSGADLIDGTPIFDIKPYVEYADSHAGVRSGFVDEHEWERLEVSFAEGLSGVLSPEDVAVVCDLLSLDPRPHYQDDPERVYGMPFRQYDIRFRVSGCHLTVVEIIPLA